MSFVSFSSVVCNDRSTMTCARLLALQRYCTIYQCWSLSKTRHKSFTAHCNALYLHTSICTNDPRDIYSQNAAEYLSMLAQATTLPSRPILHLLSTIILPYLPPYQMRASLYMFPSTSPPLRPLPLFLLPTILSPRYPSLCCTVRYGT